MLGLAGGPPKIAPQDILLVGTVRNEWLRLPCFLDHHRALGVNRFLLIDNDSDDGTTAYLQAQPDVHLFHTDESYADSNCGVSWLNEVLHRYARGHWTLILDADELFVFPGYENAGLPDLLAWLEDQGAEAMGAPLLDMYADRPLSELSVSHGDELLTACPFFDGEGYEFARLSADGPRMINRGGPRQRLFWDGFDRVFPGPLLRKIPLIRWRDNLTLEASTHLLNGARFASVSGVLLHFKFLQDFGPVARQEVNRKEHFEGAKQYSAYDEVLATTPELNAHSEASVRFQNSWQLADLGLIHVPEDYPLRPTRHGHMPQADSNSEKQYWEDFLVVDTSREDLGGNLRHGDTLTIMPGLWGALIDRFAPRSLLDVGAGEGHTLAFFHRTGVIAHGFDGSPENVALSRFPIALHDLTRGPYHFPCDLVHCVEVVEHIEERYLGYLLDTLCNAPVVVMTHALPGQKGHHHVNCQPESYWLEHFADRGYRLAEDNAYFRKLAREEKPGSYFGESGLILLKTRSKEAPVKPDLPEP